MHYPFVDEMAVRMPARTLDEWRAWFAAKKPDPDEEG